MRLDLTEATVREIRAATSKALAPSELTIGRLAGRHDMGDEELQLLVAFVRDTLGANPK